MHASTATFESCSATLNKGVRDLNIELERQKLEQTDGRNIRTSLNRIAFSQRLSITEPWLVNTDGFRLSFHAAEKYEADKDKHDIRVLATVQNIVNI